MTDYTKIHMENSALCLVVLEDFYPHTQMAFVMLQTAINP